MLLIGVALVLAAAVFATTRVLDAMHRINPKSGFGDIVGLAGNQEDTPGTLAYKIKHGQRVNILLLGYGGAQHDGAYLTDSIMVLSVQGVNRVSMTSIPRDSFVPVKAFVNGGEYDGKINAAYEIPLSNGAFGKLLPEYDQGYQGAGKLASKVVGDYLGQPIDYWVGVDFSAFKQAVDAVGGVDVVNPYVLDDPQYPLGETNAYTHVHFNAGPLHLNGDQALEYVRERHADSDFGRSRRQQQVLLAVKQKALSVGAIPHLLDLLGALQDHIKTNMSLSDLRAFSGIADKIHDNATHRVSIDNTTLQYDSYCCGGQYILLPRDHTLDTLHHFIDNELPPPDMLAEKAQVQFLSSVREASQGQNLGGVVGKMFGMIGLGTLPAGTLSTTPEVTVIHDYSGGKASKTVAWLQDYFHATVVVESPTPAPAPSGTPGAAGPLVTVDLGLDYAAPFDAEQAPSYVAPERSIPSTYVPPQPKPSPTSRPSPSPSTEGGPTPSSSPTTACDLLHHKPPCPSPSPVPANSVSPNPTTQPSTSP